MQPSTHHHHHALGALVLLSATVFIAACGGADSGNTGAGTPTASTPAPAPGAGPAPAPGPSPSPAPGPSPAPSPGGSPAPAPAPGTPLPPPVEIPAPPPSNAALGTAPQVRVLRDDRVVTLDMDYRLTSQFAQWWHMSGSPDDEAGFLVTWWPVTPTDAERAGSAVPSGSPAPRALAALPAGGKWMVTASRRAQLQPLDNDRAYRVRVQRISARGQITSNANEFEVAGGDGSRVAALRASLTHFDDFNRPAGAVDERLWNKGSMNMTDPRLNLFHVAPGMHAQTVHGTRIENTGDKSQTSERFRKRIRIEQGTARRIVFDMDSPLGPRSVWYLDLNPVPTDATGHASFFDEAGALGMPAGILRLRAGGQALSANIIDPNGAAFTVGSVSLEDLDLQMIPNVRRRFEVLVDTTTLRISVDGKQVINSRFAPYSLPAGDYEPLMVHFGYNTAKDGLAYYAHHWDNFGFDGPVVDANVVHNYVTRIAGTDYQQPNGGNAATFTVRIPDDLRPTTASARAEAWLLWTYQMADYSFQRIGPGDTVQVNGGTRYTLPPPPDNAVQRQMPEDTMGLIPRTGRIKLGDITRDGTAPLRVGDNTIRFNVADNAGLLNVHVEVHYPPGSAPAYTPPAAIHRLPMPADLPRIGPPLRVTKVGSTGIGGNLLYNALARERVTVSGRVPVNIEVGNASWDPGWDPGSMQSPPISLEVWATGGTEGIAKLEYYLRPAGSGSGPGQLVMTMDTAIDAPSPQGRYLVDLDTTRFPNGDYELFVRAVTLSGVVSHPNYPEVLHSFPTYNDLSGGYYPIGLRIQN